MIRNENGSVTLFFAMTLLLAVVFIGMVVDFGLTFIARKQVQTAADAAALAGALSAELIAETSINDTGEIEYEFNARIKSDVAEQKAEAMLQQYLDAGIMKNVQITDVKYAALDEEGNLSVDDGVFYEVIVTGEQTTLLGVIKQFRISRLAEAKLEFVEGE